MDPMDALRLKELAVKHLDVPRRQLDNRPAVPPVALAPPKHDRLEQRGVHPLPFAGDLPVEQRHQDALWRELQAEKAAGWASEAVDKMWKMRDEKMAGTAFPPFSPGTLPRTETATVFRMSCRTPRCL